MITPPENRGRVWLACKVASVAALTVSALAILLREPDNTTSLIAGWIGVVASAVVLIVF